MITEPTYYATREDGVNLYERHSDIGMMCREDGTERLYSEMIEPEGHFRKYEETDIPIEGDTDELTVDDTLAMLNQLGVDIDD
jgi:hypothetical protein